MVDSTARTASMFVDEVRFQAEAGRGGNGLVSWRREKYIEFGGPFGGDGGRGGSVYVEATESLSTLLDLRYQHRIVGENGRPGGNKGMHGRNGKDTVLRVPVGTQVFNDETDELLADLVEVGQRVLVARGGRGGRGNMRFVTATNRAPDFAEEGRLGGLMPVRLELKLLADVGIIGYPSVGKSTLISVISNARPRVAAYPFTTLIPNLGVVKWRDHDSYVVADIPGLIEGASEGRGLGHQFLRHVERCNLLVHVVDVPPPFDDGSGVEWTERDPIDDFERINAELENFNPEMSKSPQIVVLNKIDLPYVREREEELRQHFEAAGYIFLSISAATRQGVKQLIDAVGQRLQKLDPDMFEGW
jgi:GTP-binding protein